MRVLFLSLAVLSLCVGCGSAGGDDGGTGGGTAETGGGSAATGGGAAATGGGSASTGGGSAATGGGSAATGGGSSAATGGGSSATGGGGGTTIPDGGSARFDTEGGLMSSMDALQGQPAHDPHYVVPQFNVVSNATQIRPSYAVQDPVSGGSGLIDGTTLGLSMPLAVGTYTCGQPASGIYMSMQQSRGSTLVQLESIANGGSCTIDVTESDPDAGTLHGTFSAVLIKTVPNTDAGFASIHLNNGEFDVRF